MTIQKQELVGNCQVLFLVDRTKAVVTFVFLNDDSIFLISFLIINYIEFFWILLLSLLETLTPCFQNFYFRNYEKEQVVLALLSILRDPGFIQGQFPRSTCIRAIPQYLFPQKLISLSMIDSFIA